jgi:EAL domain-containing protein (putative c-di-GMP-specific phosphodiesterase class I)
MGTAPWTRSNSADEFDSLVASRRIAAAFQPIVHIHSGDVVGYEALARPPANSSFPDPASLFAEGYRRGRVGELDWACRAAVCTAVLEKKVPRELPVFVNIEPVALNAPCPADIIGLVAAATNQCRYVVELTERSLADDPAQLLVAVGRTREASVGVALDDVGADPASLALMPLVAPDVIKLDLRLIQARPNEEIAQIVNAVLAESERTGAAILAEGVESARHVAVAQSMGATLGQGMYFGPPAALPDDFDRPNHPLEMINARSWTGDTPFMEASASRVPIAATKELLIATARYLEHEVLHSSDRAVLLSSFMTVANFGPTMQSRYEELARRTVLTAAFGRDMPSEPGQGIRGVDLHPDDPLCREWTVVVLGSQLAAALIARRSDDSQSASPSRLDAIITHDRDLVVAAAKSLIQRLPPLNRSTHAELANDDG